MTTSNWYELESGQQVVYPQTKNKNWAFP